MDAADIAKNVTLGIDLGIASIGWALIDEDRGEILGCGVRTFDAPEKDDKGKKTPKNQQRRQARLMRRVIRRRAQRVATLRRFLRDLLGAEAVEASLLQDPWAARATGLDRELTDAEFASALLHLAKHRGFQSNRKGGETNVVDEDKRALAAMADLEQRLVGYRTFGEMIQIESQDRTSPIYRKKRNRSDEYGRTPKRKWLKEELDKLVDAQRRLGNGSATDEILEKFEEIAWFQRPLADSVDLVRECSFEPGEKRCSRFAPSFERFRLLQSLAHLRLWAPKSQDRALEPEEIAKIEVMLGQKAKLSFEALRKALDLTPSVRFRGVAEKDEKRDVATTGAQGGSRGIRAFRKSLGDDLYRKIGERTLDDAMFEISFRQSASTIRAALEELDLTADAVERLIESVARGEFDFATGAAHISANACRALLPGLRDGLTYSEACAQAGYDHTSPGAEALARLRRPTTRLALTEIFADHKRSPINSPVARKAVIEALKQFTAVVNEHPSLLGSLPGRVHIELARDIGKGPEERAKIKNGIAKRLGEKNKAAEEFEKTLGRPPRAGSNELKVYELAKEQNWRCVYTDEVVDPHRLLDGTSYQIDHILPWSRFGDDSFHNLTLCTALANQAKRGRTPFEWFDEDKQLQGAPLDWPTFVARVEALSAKGLKKRNYLITNASEREEAFRERNLNDTKFASRVLLRAISLIYPPIIDQETGKERRICRARPGALTAKLRCAWGLDSLKRDDHGERIENDQHHALDAVVVAATSESMLNRLTRAHQEAERLGKPRDFEHVDPPWPEFRTDTESAVCAVFVSRAERRRARGQAHDETINAIDPASEKILKTFNPAALLDGIKVDFEDKDKWREALEQRFKNPKRSKAIIDELERWARDERTADAPPLGPTGDPIRKIRAWPPKDARAAVRVRGGAAGRGDMVRIDVFSKENKNGRAQFYLVPIYPHQLHLDAAPTRAVVSGKQPEDWEQIESAHSFCFSLWHHSFLEVTTSKGEIIDGYFKGLDINTGAISIASIESLKARRTGIGARNLLRFEKYHVDRLGRKHRVTNEVRQWRGEASISAALRD